MEGLFWVGILVFVFWAASKASNTNEIQQLESGSDKNMICPHCHTKGTVATRKIKQKQGIHGGKATAAVLTAGITLIGTGLSRKNQVTEAHCSNCGATWRF